MSERATGFRVVTVTILCLALPACSGPSGATPTESANHVEQRVALNNPVGEIQAFAGDLNGARGYSPNGAAVSSQLNSPQGLAIGPDGKVYIADTGNNRILRVDGSTMTTVVAAQTAAPGVGYGNLLVNPGAETPQATAGTIPGWRGWSGTSVWDEVTRSTAAADQIRPEPLDGDWYFRAGATATDRLVQVVDVSMYPSVAAGTQWFSFSGYVSSLDQGTNSDQAEIVIQYRGLHSALIEAFDSGPIASRGIWQRVHDVHLAPAGTLSIWVNLISTRQAGTGDDAYYDGLSLRALPAGDTVGDGGPAVNATLDKPKGMVFGTDGALYVADSYNHRIRRVQIGGNISSIGSGVPGYVDFSSFPQFNYPTDVGLNDSGDLFVADFLNHRVRRISNPTQPQVSTYMGSDTPSLSYPSGVAFDPYNAGGIWVTDRSNFRVIDNFKVLGSGRGFADSPEAFLPPFALFGRTQGVVSVPGAFANTPDKVSFSAFVADLTNHAIRHIDDWQNSQTVVGSSGVWGNGGDNGAGYTATLAEPTALAYNAAQNQLFIADTENNRIRVLNCASWDRCGGTDLTCSSTGVPTVVSHAVPQLNDGNVCTFDVCWWTTGEVTHPPNSAVHICGDDNVCNGTETCSGSGACLPGTPLAAGTSCSDGNACNGSETCDASHVCQPGALPVLDDGNMCTVDACSASGGVTNVAVADGTACSTNDPCRNPGTCVSGQCNTTAIVLDTSNPCVTETCTGSAGVVRAFVSGSCPGGTCVSGSCVPSGGITAPALDNTVPPSSSNLFAAIYGTGGVQTGTSVGTGPAQLNPDHAAHLFGVVTDSTGAGLAGVTVIILNHTESGQTLTRADGKFDIVANGGGPLVVRFTKTGRFTVDRQANPIWGGGAHIDDVVMLAADSAATSIAVNSGSFQDAAGTTTTAAMDSRGLRTARVVFPASTTASAVDAAGNSTPLTAMTVHATEFTIGTSAQALSRMPAPLPGSSLYTYAVDFSVDQAPAGSSVVFNQPVFSYVDNFLGLPTGAPVPSGYYDPQKTAWVPEHSGIVMAVVGYSAGAAVVDLTGDGIENASDLAIWNTLPANERITTGERALIATRYPGGTPSVPKSVWRIPLSHFSYYDFNQAGGVSCVGNAPACPTFDGIVSGGADAPIQGSCEKSGSIIGAEEQSLGESLPVMGTPYTLEYRSSYTLGYLPPRGVEVDFQRNPPPTVLAPGERRVELATPSGSWTVIRPASYENYIAWNGLDSSGRRVNGSQLATILATQVYTGSYKRMSDHGLFGDAAESDTVSVGYGIALAAPDVFFTRKFTKVVSAWGSDVLGLGGWTLSPMHVYDPAGAILYQGDGRQRNLHDEPGVRLVAGNGTSTNSTTAGTLAVNTGIAASSTPSLAVASNGNVYFASVGAAGTSVLRMIDAVSGVVSDVINLGTDPTTTGSYFPGRMSFSPDGRYLYLPAFARVLRVDVVLKTMQVFAGTGVRGYADGPANAATFTAAAGSAVAPDGTLFITDGPVVRKITPDNAHTVSTVAGAPSGAPYTCDNTDPSLNAEGKPAKGVLLSRWGTTATAPAVAADGSLWIGTGQDLIRVDPQGLAHCIRPGQPIVGGIAMGSDQNLYFAVESSGSTGSPAYSIRRLMPDGSSTVIAGGLGCGEPFDGQRASTARTCMVEAMSAGPDGSLYFVNSPDNVAARIFKLAIPVTAGGANCAIALPSEDGTQKFCFDVNGRHLSTRNAVTGAVLLTFNYTNGLLSSIVNAADSNTTTITAATATTPVVITGPFGQTTKIGLDPTTKYAKYIEDAAQKQTLVSHDANGLLLSMTDRNSKQHTFSYDTLGRLKRDADPANGFQTLTRNLQPNGYSVSDVSAMGATSTYAVSVDPQGVESRSVKLPDGSTNQSTLDLSGGSTTTFADGSVETQTTIADPLWPSYQPYVNSTSLKLPSGLTRAVSSTKTVSYQVGVTPPTIDKVTEQVTDAAISSNPLKSEFKNSTQTYTVTTPGSRIGTRSVDSFGRPLSVSPVGSIDTDGSAIAGGVKGITYAYDRGRLASVIQGTRQTTLEYFPTTASTPGQLKKITVADTAGSISTLIVPDKADRALSSTTEYSTQTPTTPRETDFAWDAEGNLSSVTPPSDLSPKPFHTQTYTPVNLLQSYLPPAVSDVPDSTTSFFYNFDRGLEYVRQPGGRGVDYVYNPGTGQLINVLADGVSSAAFTYYPPPSTSSGAAPGRLQTAVRGATTVTLKYDGPLTTSQAWSGTGSDAANGSASWAYDKAFRVTTETVAPAPSTAGLNVVSYAYDPDGMPTCASLSSCATGAANKLALSYDAKKGQLTGTSLGVVTESYGWNAYGELASYSATNGSITYTATYDDGTAAASRDGFGRIKRESNMFASADYQYDEQGRIWKVSIGGIPTREYHYDANGNRKSFDLAGTVIATYDNQDRMLTYNGASYSYGPNGERKRRAHADGSVDEYQYDAVGNLSHVTRNDTVSIDYVVDALNRRIAKKLNGSTVARYIYRNGLSLAAILDGTGNLLARFVYASMPNTPDFMVLRDGTVYKFVNDQRGSPRIIVNTATGAVAQQTYYDEFGNSIVTNSAGFDPSVQPFGFAGGLYDPDTGLVRFGARDYEAETGRWLAKDPTLFKGDQANLYVYVNNDPVNNVDVNGLLGDNVGFTVGAGSPFLPLLGGLFGVTLPTGAGVSVGIFKNFDFSSGDLTFGFYMTRSVELAPAETAAFCYAGTEAGLILSNSFKGSGSAIQGEFGDLGGSVGYTPGSFIPDGITVNGGLGGGGFIGINNGTTSIRGISAGLTGVHFAR